MSRLTTKQRRARLWRRDWVKDVIRLRADGPHPGTFRGEEWHAMAPDMATHAQWSVRDRRVYPGLRTPQSPWPKIRGWEERRHGPK